MVLSVLCITSQVEHTKKYNNIDSENKFLKLNANHQNHLTVYRIAQNFDGGKV